MIKDPFEGTAAKCFKFRAVRLKESLAREIDDARRRFQMKSANFI